MYEVADRHLFIHHTDQLGGQLLIVLGREHKHAVAGLVGDDRRLHAGLADVALALRDLGLQHSVDVRGDLLGPRVLQEIGLRAGFGPLGGLELRDQAIHERQLVGRREHDQRVGGRLRERARLELTAALRRADRPQIRLNLGRHLRRIQHLQRVGLDLDAACVLGVQLADQLPHVVELGLRRPDNQYPVAHQRLHVLLATLAGGAALRTIESIDGLRHLVRIGVFHLDRDRLDLGRVLPVQGRDEFLGQRVDELRRIDDDLVLPRIDTDVDAVGEVLSLALLHLPGQLLLQQVRDIAGVGDGNGVNPPLERQILRPRRELGDQIIDLWIHVRRRAGDDLFRRHVRNERGAQSIRSRDAVHDLVQGLGDLVHIAAWQLDGPDGHLLALGIVKLLDERLDRRELLLRGFDDHLRAGGHGANLGATRRPAAAGSTRPGEYGLHGGGHILRPRIFQLEEALLGGLLGDVLVHPQGEVLDLVHVGLVGLDDQRVRDRLGLNQRPARRPPQTAGAARKQGLELLLKLRGIGVDQRQNLHLVADVFHVQRLDQLAYLLQRRTHGVYPHFVAIGLDGDGRPPEHRMLVLAVQRRERVGDGLGAAAGNREHLELRGAGQRALVPHLDRLLDLRPVLRRTHHDQDLGFVQRDQLVIRGAGGRPAARQYRHRGAPARHPRRARRRRRTTAAGEQRLDHLRHGAGPQVLKLDDVPLLRGAGHVELLDELRDLFHHVALGHDVERVLGLVGHDGGRGACAARRRKPADDLRQQRRDVGHLGVLQDKGAEVVGQRFVDDLQHILDALHTFLVGVNDQRVGPRVGHQADRLLGPLEHTFHKDVLGGHARLHRRHGRLRRHGLPTPEALLLLLLLLLHLHLDLALNLPLRQARLRLPLFLLQNLIQEVGDFDCVGVPDFLDPGLELADVGFLIELANQVADLVHLLAGRLDDDRVGALVGDHQHLAVRAAAGAHRLRHHASGGGVAYDLHLGWAAPAADAQQAAHALLDVRRVGLDVEDPHLADILRGQVDAVLQRQEAAYVAGQADDLDLVAVGQRHQGRGLGERVEERVDVELRGPVRHLVVDDDEVHIARIGLVERLDRVVRVLQRHVLLDLVDRDDANVVFLFDEPIPLLVHDQVQLVDRLLLRELAVVDVRQLAPDLHVALEQRFADPLDEVGDHVLPGCRGEVEPLRRLVRVGRKAGLALALSFGRRLFLAGQLRDFGRFLRRTLRRRVVRQILGRTDEVRRHGGRRLMRTARGRPGALRRRPGPVAHFLERLAPLWRIAARTARGGRSVTSGRRSRVGRGRRALWGGRFALVARLAGLLMLSLLLLHLIAQLEELIECLLRVGGVRRLRGRRLPGPCVSRAPRRRLLSQRSCDGEAQYQAENQAGKPAVGRPQHHACTSCGR